MLSVITFLWRDPKYRWNDRFLYTADHVNRLAASVRRNLHIPHEFVCVTDMPEGIDASVRIVPLWDDHRAMGGCYMRLKLFSPEMRELIGERFVQIDVDSVVVGDLTPLLDRNDDFIAWRNIGYPTTPYCGSMFMMRAGARPDVWSTFDPVVSPKIASAENLCGTDQAWMGHVLGKDMPSWSAADGVLSFRSDINAKHRGELPPGARIVFFHGPYDPSMPAIQERGWVREHWRT